MERATELGRTRAINSETPILASSLRNAAVAALVAGIVAAVWLAISSGGFADLAILRRHYIFILLYAYAVLALPAVIGGTRRDSFIAIIGGLILSVPLMVDLTTVRFFDEAFFNIYPYLPVQAGTATLDGVVGYATSYIPPLLVVLAVGTIFVALATASLARKRTLARWAILAAIPLLFAGNALARWSGAGHTPEIAALMAEPEAEAVTIGAAQGPRAVSVDETSIGFPETVVLVVMESAGSTVPSSDGQNLLSEAIIKQSGVDGWINFADAVTASNATDIAVPAILTGTGPHEPRAKLHTLPLVSQLAKARGFSTAFITSSSMRWAGFEDFVADAGLDSLTSAADSGLPFVNDLAVDDAFVYQAAAQQVETAEGPLFLILYPQALHWPFQTESALPIGSGLVERRSRAAAITEAGFSVLFDALRETGRLERSLIIATGDHGEFDYADTLRVPRMRLDTFAEGILSPIFFVKAPGGSEGDAYAALASNRDALVSNVDIAPSISAMLGAYPADGQSYVGQNLFAPIPQERIAYASATNSWRAWPKAAIAVARGNERLVCDQRELCRYGIANGGSLSGLRPAEPDHPLLRLALEQESMRRALAQVYREHHY